MSPAIHRDPVDRVLNCPERDLAVPAEAAFGPEAEGVARDFGQGADRAPGVHTEHRREVAAAGANAHQARARRLPRVPNGVAG